MNTAREVLESTVKIYFTTDYARFVFLKENRRINDVKVKKLIKSIEDGFDMLKYNPIQVHETENGSFEIVDGQHRYKAAQMTRRPVFFIKLDRKLEVREIAKMNSLFEKWNSGNYIHSYVTENNTNYDTLRTFLETYNLGMTLSLRLLLNGNVTQEHKGNNLYDLFHEGLFEVKTLPEAEKFAKVLALFSGFKDFRGTRFSAAIEKIFLKGTADMEDLAERFKKSDFKAQNSWKDYATELQRVYNFKRREQIAIF